MNTNSLVLVGNLVDTPEVQVTQSGAVRTRIRVAHTERRRDAATETWSDGESVFMDVVCRRRLAENTGNSLAKGDRVIVVGRLRQWTAERDGNRRTVVEVEAESIGPDLQRAVVTVARQRRPVAVASDPLAEGAVEVPDQADGEAAGPDDEPGAAWPEPLVGVGD